MKAKTRRLLSIVFVMGSLLALTGCGGGSGSSGSASAKSGAASTPQTVSGVVASGAPIAGYVYLKDSASPAHVLGPNQIGADGGYSFDVSGLTPPFYLQAVGSSGGQGFQLYSAATGPGTANINPFTSVAVAAAASTNDPGEVYDDPTQYPVTASGLASAVNAIQTLLQPLLTAYGASGDFLNGAYSANGAGLDELYDFTKVSLDTVTGRVTVSDRTTGNVIATTQTTNVSGGTLDTTSIPTPATVAQALTDMEAIAAQATALMTVINSKGASATSQDLDPFFAGDAVFGINDGIDRAGEIAVYLDKLAKNLPAGAMMTGARTSLIGESGGKYTVGITTTFSDGTVYSTNPDGNDSFFFAFDGNAWKLAGNGYKSSFVRNPFCAASYRFILSDGTSQTATGLALSAGDVGGYDLQTALVKGPGLPADGVTIAKPAGAGTIDLVPYYPQTPYRITGVTGFWPFTDVYALDDAALAAIPDGAAYTYTFYDSKGATVETRIMTLPRRPLKSTELADACPTLGGQTSHGLSSVQLSSALAFTYAPASWSGFSAAAVRGSLQIWDASGDSGCLAIALPMNQTSSSLTITQPSGWTPTAALLDLTVADVFNRQMHAQWIFAQ